MQRLIHFRSLTLLQRPHFTPRPLLISLHRPRTMATDHTGTHKDPVTGEMISKQWAFTNTLYRYPV